MKILIEISITRDGDRLDKSRGWTLLREARGKLNEPADAAELAGRARWLGGAMRMFSDLTGDSIDSIVERLGSVPPVDGVASPSQGVPEEGMRVVPVRERTNRPPRTPGAQRVVSEDSDTE